MRSLVAALVVLAAVMPSGGASSMSMGPPPLTTVIDAANGIPESCGGLVAMHVTGVQGWTFHVEIVGDQGASCGNAVVAFNDTFTGDWDGRGFAQSCLQHGAAQFCLVGNSIQPPGPGTPSWQASFTSGAFHAQGQLRGRIVSVNQP